MDCPYCNIISGKIPSFEIFRDESVLCCLELFPINPGHSLIVTLEHYSSLTIVPPKVLSAMFNLAPLVAQALARETEADGFNLHLANGSCAGQVVSHTHMHVIPRLPNDGFFWNWRKQDFEDKTLKYDLVSKVIKRLHNQLEKRGN